METCNGELLNFDNFWKTAAIAFLQRTIRRDSCFYGISCFFLSFLKLSIEKLSNYIQLCSEDNNLDCGTFGVKYFSLESIFLCGTYNEAQRDRHLTLTGYFLGFMKNVAK